MIGQRVLRKEDPRFLTGQGRYVENLPLEGALHVTFVRSPLARAKINSIDTALAAEKAQVFTAADLDIGKFGPPFPAIDAKFARPFMAEGEVNFAGEIVAAVVASSRVDAVDAAELVDVDYDPLDPLVTPEQALEAGAICMKAGPDEPDATLFDGCEVVVSGRVVSQRMAPSPLEPRSNAAVVGEDGRVTAWLSTQTPHQDRDGMARALGLEADQVRVIGPDVGGGFGAKGLGVEDVLVAWLARKTGKPVRWTETRTENMTAMHHGRAATLDVTIGGSRDGKIEAFKLHVLQDAGAYPGIGAVLPMFTGMMSSGVYAIPKIETSSVSVVTNTTQVAAFRGAGRPEATQAIERAVDLFAAEIGMDPAEVRRKNFIGNDAFPHQTASGATYDIGNYEGALDKALSEAGYDDLRAEQKRRRESGDDRALGIGLSVYVEITNGMSEAEFGAVEITAEGGAILRTGSFSHGQGHETTFAQIVADRLGMDVEQVEVIKGDTDQVARGTGTYGSKSTQIGGAAAGEAANEVREKAKQLVADELEAAPEDIVFEHGTFMVAGTPARSLSWADVAAKAQERGSLADLAVEKDFNAGAASFPFGAHLAVVEVDTSTGEVDVRRMVAVDDAGTIINPVVAAGQVHGGVATGVAQALFEEFTYDEGGNPVAINFVGYGFPSAADLPPIEVNLMETPTPLNALGAKGIGESGTIGTTPAVQNAVIDAVAHLGVKHIDMPANGERVWRAIQEAGA